MICSTESSPLCSCVQHIAYMPTPLLLISALSLYSYTQAQHLEYRSQLLIDNYHGLKVFVPKIIMYWNFNSDGGAIMNWVREKGSFHQDKLLGFIYKRPERCLFSSRWRHWNHQSWIRKCDLISQQLDLGFLASWTVRKKFLVFVSHLVYSVWLL